jgi:hypothetical protein
MGMQCLHFYLHTSGTLVIPIWPECNVYTVYFDLHIVFFYVMIVQFLLSYLHPHVSAIENASTEFMEPKVLMSANNLS